MLRSRSNSINALPDIGQIEMRPVADLVPYLKNPRLHGPESIAAVMASIQEFGFRNPVLVDGENGIVAGHARVEAAKRLGLAELPTLQIRGLTKAQLRAYVMADNAIAERSTWDTDLLRFELGELDTEGFDLSVIGFSDEQLAQLLAECTEGLTDPDEVPDVPEQPVTREGDLWLLGKHRLLCGDATVEGDVKRLLAGIEPHLMVTDPPYGVEYDPDWRNRVERRLTGRPIGAFATGQPLNDDRADWREAWMLFPGDVLYIWHAGLRARDTIDALQESGFEIRSQIIWAKNNFAIGRGHYHVQHEPCYYAVRKSANGYWRGDRSQTTLWRIDKPMKSETGHSAQTPVECMRRPMENNSSPGQAIYDPFVGSGTTVIAAEMTGRVCHAIEIAPAYVDVAVIRWQNFSGKEAILDGTKSTFNEIKVERGGAQQERAHLQGLRSVGVNSA